ncbi:hypothetical protein HDU98_007480 [Podochytrium sp. JEL0797]|nr:hypothetical protein HDU98_007480 [Podochytrium sp. JEL0797]
MSAGRSVPMSRAMSSIERDHMKFVVFDAPNDSNLKQYLEELKSRNVKCIVRVCEPTYEKAVVEQAGIQVFDWAFSDGTCPPPDVILNFLKLCDEKFSAKEDGGAIGIHCIAGLGRAPVLVAIALIESGMVPLEAIEYVRKQRRGAFNSIQLAYLAETYKRQRKKGVNSAAPVSAGNGRPKSAGLFGMFKKK